jgi:dTDP-N-acetylfucosamine:lipid II N-acetylfucosaminyltransferase
MFFFWGGEFYEEPNGYDDDFIYDKKTRRWLLKQEFSKHKLPRRPDNFLRHIIKQFSKKANLVKQFELKKQTVQRINYIIYPPNFNYEIEWIKKRFHAPDIIYKEGFYNQNFDFSKRIFQTSNEKEISKKKILVGNSATDTNNHLDCFSWLTKDPFLGEDAEILCPLSYGDDCYKAHILKVGKSTFGDRFKPITNFMDRNSYIRFLSGVDAAVFFHNRSQGFGNIISLITLGKKVYLKPHNPFYIYLKSINVKVFSVLDNLSEIKTNMFIPFTDEENEENSYHLKANLSDDVRLKLLYNLISSN